MLFLLCFWERTCNMNNILKRIFVLLIAIFALSPHSSAFAHEAWLLTPNQILMLNSLPLPQSFAIDNILTLLIMVGMVAAFMLAYWVEIILKPKEKIYERKILPFIEDYLPLIVRLCLGFIMMYAAFGSLPRHGIGAYGSPTLFVPDLDLRIIGATGTEWLCLAKLQFILAMTMILGVFVRVSAVCIMGLVILGASLFGAEMMISYAAHFMMPALFLLCVGAGKYYKLSLPLPKICAQIEKFFSECDMRIIYQVILIGTGFNFVLLALVFKFMQPNLLINILVEGNFPLFGLPVEYMALLMAMIEVIAGFCIMMGILVRPLCVFLIGAMCLFAVILGENLVMHANIFAIMFICLFYGSTRSKDEDYIAEEFYQEYPAFA